MSRIDRTTRKIVMYGSIEQHNQIDKAFKEYVDKENEERYDEVMKKNLRITRDYLRNNTTLDEKNMSDQEVRKHFLIQEEKTIVKDDPSENGLTENWINDLVEIQNTKENGATT